MGPAWDRDRDRAALRVPVLPLLRLVDLDHGHITSPYAASRSRRGAGGAARHLMSMTRDGFSRPASSPRTHAWGRSLYDPRRKNRVARVDCDPSRPSYRE